MRVLDLFCKAGGASEGLHRAFPKAEIVGVDIEPQPHYPFRFIQRDAIDFLLSILLAGYAPFDFIWASPPCQKHSSLNGLGKQSHRVRTCIIEPLRTYLNRTGSPYAIENVIGAPLKKSVVLCGQYFGLGGRRHRIIETNFPIAKIHCKFFHKPRPVAVYGDHPEKHSYKPGSGGYINRAHTLEMGQKAMGINWMDWPELTQAVPPAYSEYVAKQYDAGRGGR